MNDFDILELRKYLSKDKDRVAAFGISTEATIQMSDGSLRDPIGKPPLVKIEFESGKTIVAEVMLTGF